MNLIDKLNRKETTLSYEFFPPKSADGWSNLYGAMGSIDDKKVDMVSVTYGAGGSTRDKTVDLVGRIQSELNIDAMAHLTCVGHNRYELFKILDKLKENDIKAIMALRGDPQQGSDGFKPEEKGFSYGSELIKFIKEIFDFYVGCACYPEGHTESDSLEQDIKFLKIKEDNGADFAVTQVFFSNDIFYRFRDKAIAAGVTIPILAGIMPASSPKQLARFKELCGCTIPEELTSILTDLSTEDAEARGREYAYEQCDDLIKNDVAGLHLYTLNKAYSSDIAAKLKM